MALESKPLFHPEVIRQQVRAFSLPERTGDWQPKLQHWAGLIDSGRADDFQQIGRGWNWLAFAPGNDNHAYVDCAAIGISNLNTTLSPVRLAKKRKGIVSDAANELRYGINP
jgi:hypothetical protein